MKHTKEKRRKTPATTPDQNDETRSEGKAGKPQTMTNRATAEENPPAVTSGSRSTHRRTRGSPSPQTLHAMTPKQTIQRIYEKTKVAQTDVTSVCRALFEIAGEQVIACGMFTLPELGIRLKRHPMPQTGRVAEGGDVREEEFVLTTVPLKRLLVSTRAVRSD